MSEVRLTTCLKHANLDTIHLFDMINGREKSTHKKNYIVIQVTTNQNQSHIVLTVEYKTEEINSFDLFPQHIFH